MLENVVHKLNVVLLAITILSGCLSCVRIDVPQFFFTEGQEYSTKKQGAYDNARKCCP